MSGTLCCVGNLTIDVAVAPDLSAVESAGGDALYAALAARLVGGRPRVLAPIGADATPALVDAIRASGTDPSALPRRADPTVRNVVRYDATGGRTWELVHGEANFEAMSVWPADVDDEARQADGILLSAMALRPQVELAGWLRPRTAAVVYFDPQEDYIAGNEDAVRAAVAGCDVFLPSEVEAHALAGTTDPAVACREFLALGPRVVVITLAENGCCIATAEAPQPVFLPAERVEPVDSTGAGDAFAGAFAAVHLRTGDPIAAARAGSRAARAAVSGHGIDGLLTATAEPAR
ncbi:carbohydrate kinase family protein [Nakamurella flava]|uniref:Carbohydrate kinase family protein n=1 Tax=Nakamurella flava TaxID=2576308 RepID=A0A4U6QCF2_9ACTN|nr:carbohydrate kinase family protein [Nakamurella flava]TKV57700.1 carbohydrate kinase family protein [Nakamurella flava]